MDHGKINFPEILKPAGGLPAGGHALGHIFVGGPHRGRPPNQECQQPQTHSQFNLNKEAAAPGKGGGDGRYDEAHNTDNDVHDLLLDPGDPKPLQLLPHVLHDHVEAGIPDPWPDDANLIAQDLLPDPRGHDVQHQ